MSTPFAMHETLDLTNHVRVSCYAYRVGISCQDTQTSITIHITEYSATMKLEDGASKEDIEEAMSHLRATQKNTHNLRIAQWCSEEIDRLLDAKLEMKR